MHTTPHSEEAKQRMREAKLKNPTRYWLGKKMPVEMREKMSEAKVGYSPWNAGLTAQEDARVAKNAAVRVGQVRSAESCVKMSESHIGLFSGENHPNWQGGKSFEPYPLGWTKTFKEQIRYRDGYRCQLCGTPEIENGRKLDVHHKDYNKNNLDPENLLSLCKRCHPKTNANRNFWLKFFLVEGGV